MPKSPHNSHKPGKEPKPGKCPPLEEAACFYIENENDKQRILDFAGWLRKNKLSPAAGNNSYSWYVRFHYINHNVYKNDKYQRSTYHGLYIKFFDDTWHILPSKDILEHVLLRDCLKEIVWESVFPCYGCSYGCFKSAHNERAIMLFGRQIPAKGACLRQPICLTNPNSEIIGVIKEILLNRKNSDDLVIGLNKNIYNYGMM